MVIPTKVKLFGLVGVCLYFYMRFKKKRSTIVNPKAIDDLYFNYYIVIDERS